MSHLLRRPAGMLATVAALALSVLAHAAEERDARVVTWTYNHRGQKLTATTPDHRITSWTYYEDRSADHQPGDLASETTSDGQTTRYTRYSRAGQLLESIDPDGVLTVRTYDLQQRMVSRNEGGRITRFSYDATGQLRRLTFPDGSWLGWDHDAALRTTAVYDSHGHRIDYRPGTLLPDQVHDADGCLPRNLARAAHALAR